MGSPTTIPDIVYQKPDGNLFHRIEMEQQIRDKWPKVHWLRIIATKNYGLPKNLSWDMKEIVLRHWLLDEMIRRGHATGDLVGVNAQASNEEAEVRQFIQRLAGLISAGAALQPQQAEGIDMGNFAPPPPPMMGGTPPNGQNAPAFAPPTPSGPPMMQPPGAPPGFAPVPPPVPPGFAPPGVPANQPPNPGFSPPPGFAPPGVSTPPPGPATTGGRGRRKAAPDAAPPTAAPVPPTMPMSVVSPGVPATATFAPLPAPNNTVALPTVPTPVGTQMTASVDLSPVLKALEQSRAEVDALRKELTLVSMIATLSCRALYGKQGNGDATTLLKEFGLIPQ
jgi:hypothetical protein